MSIPPVQTSTFAPAQGLKPAARRNRTGERLALTGVAVVAILALALWQVPPMLDWSRYKGAIAAYAGARLGRRITIDGHVALSLLPRAALTVDGVTLADRGDGISARLGTMRLEVSLRGLLAGHVVPRALTLDNPVAALPWPMPRGAAPLHAAVAEAFTATLMGGTLHLGGVTFRDIAASLQTDPDSGAFDAQGYAMVAGLPWRFTAIVGAPASDGASPLTLTLDGQAPYGRGAAVPGLLGTGAAFHGRILADGVVVGKLAMHGPDLSVLGHAPAAPWQVQGDVRGDGLTLRAPSLHLVIGPSAGVADASLSLGASPALTVRLALDTVAFGDWAGRLFSDASGLASHLPAELDVSAARASWHGGTIETPHLVMSLRNDGVAIRTASAGLPGGAQLGFSGVVPPRQVLAGRFTLHAPDARRTLRWLTQGGTEALPPEILRQADVSGMIGMVQDRAALTDLAGQIDHSAVSGSVVLGAGQRPSIGLDLAVETLDLAAWLPGLVQHGQGTVRFPNLAMRAAPWPHNDIRLQLRVAHLIMPGLAVDHANLDAEAGQGGVTVHPSSGDAAGGHLILSGRLADDGTLTAGRAEFATTDAARLPVAWRLPVTLWHGPLHVVLSAAGPATDTAAQLRADLGDLRAEAEAHIDQTAARAAATVTFRHPGAPRLLAELGWPGTEAWLDHGSFALLTHVLIAPDYVQLKDFSVAAAAFHAEGTLDTNFGETAPTVTGTIDAPVLALPAASIDSVDTLPWAAFSNLRADLHVKAAEVLSGLAPVATDITAHVLAGGGVAAVQDVNGTVSGGHFAAQLAGDVTQDPPVLSAMVQMRHAQLPAPDTNAPIPPDRLWNGSLDADGDVAAKGRTTRALVASASGDAMVSFRDVTLTGIDLARLSASMAARGPKWKSRLTAALQAGTSPGLAGEMVVSGSDGAMTVAHLDLAGPDGALHASGTADASTRRADFRGHIQLVANGLPINFTAVGLWPNLVHTFDVPPEASRQTHSPHRAKHR